MNTRLIARLPALLMSVVMTFGMLGGIDSLSEHLRADAPAAGMAQQQTQPSDAA